LILLDTHAWLWLRSEPSKLPEALRVVVSYEGLAVSAVSCFEVATLARLGRIALDRPTRVWIAQALEAEPRVSAMPITAEIAAVAGDLGAGFPGDPADRLIYATAAGSGWRIATRDRRIRAFDHSRAIWD
jgi:PIN domain nuclease of toxin-antitoxin system